LEENIPNDNQRISLVEMDEIPVYESINENQMLSNLAFCNVICSGLVYVQWVRGYCSFGGIVDYHYLNRNVDITSSAHNAFLE
jgi:hypothetical protein